MGPARPTHRETTQLSISGAWFQYVVRCLGDLGVPIDEICEDLQIDLQALMNPDGRVGRDTATLVWREAARRSEDPLLGLHAAGHFRLGLNNVLAHLIVSAANLGEALEVLGRYQTLVAARSVVTLDRRGTVTAIIIDPAEGRVPVSRHQSEFITGAIAQMIRGIAEKPVAFAGVQFRHECPGDTAAYRAAFGCAVTFRARENSLLLDAAVLEMPTADHSASVARRLRAIAEEELSCREAESVSYLVELAIRQRLRAGDVTQARVEDVARELHFSTRSLQRHLAEESQTFAALLAGVRRDLALGMLDEGLSREVIARRLGFTSATTLSRALRRWQG